MSKRRAIILAGVLLAACMIFFVQASHGVTIERDVVYGHADGVDLKLDMVKPTKGTPPYPAVVCIHGGAWAGGAKKDMESSVQFFAAHGYLAVSVEYRMAPTYKWPAMIEDVKCAVRYLRAHAKELNIDPKNIFATGASAGGHLSLMLGLMGPKDGLEGNGGYTDQPSTVRGVANFFGPTDMRIWDVTSEPNPPDPNDPRTTGQKIMENFLGTSDRNAPIVKQVSPIVYVDKDDPPILSFHGTKDDIVPFSQATLLHEALKKVGVPEKLVVMKDDGHGWGGGKFKGSLREALRFFDAIRMGKPIN